MLQMALKIKCRGSTLVEILVALSIITFCSALGLVIYLNIQKSTKPFMLIKSKELALQYINETIKTKNYFDEVYNANEYTVKKTILRNERFSDCLNIRVIVYNIEEKKLTEMQTTVYAE